MNKPFTPACFEAINDSDYLPLPVGHDYHSYVIQLTTDNGYSVTINGMLRDHCETYQEACERVDALREEYQEYLRTDARVLVRRLKAKRDEEVLNKWISEEV